MYTILRVIVKPFLSFVGPRCGRGLRRLRCLSPKPRPGETGAIENQYAESNRQLVSSGPPSGPRRDAIGGTGRDDSDRPSCRRPGVLSLPTPTVVRVSASMCAPSTMPGEWVIWNSSGPSSVRREQEKAAASPDAGAPRRVVSSMGLFIRELSPETQSAGVRILGHRLLRSSAPSPPTASSASVIGSGTASGAAEDPAPQLASSRDRSSSST